MTTPIDLPPLPHTRFMVDAGYRSHQIRDYAIAAVLADRQMMAAAQPVQPAEPVAWQSREWSGEDGGFSPWRGTQLIDLPAWQQRVARRPGLYEFRPLYLGQPAYDQTALELCTTCGWKTLIPGDCCLNCERFKSISQPASTKEAT